VFWLDDQALLKEMCYIEQSLLLNREKVKVGERLLDFGKRVPDES
jgi:hypothetical protein